MAHSDTTLGRDEDLVPVPGLREPFSNELLVTSFTVCDRRIPEGAADIESVGELSMRVFFRDFSPGTGEAHAPGSVSMMRLHIRCHSPHSRGGYLNVLEADCGWHDCVLICRISEN